MWTINSTRFSFGVDTVIEISSGVVSICVEVGTGVAVETTVDVETSVDVEINVDVGDAHPASRMTTKRINKYFFIVLLPIMRDILILNLI
ncbi:MAG: hypothetical protein LLG42_07380 [Chloroflexi bacterium]|nr:hypothetical protein [Chloroflexota bacterium]